MPAVAKKLDPALWQQSKRRACTHAKLCLHSARKMQWAVRDYKRRGGRYASRSRSRSNRLARWSRQKWRTHDGTPSRGKKRYLPDAAWRTLSPDQIRRTNRAKARGHSKGKQWVRQPTDVARATRRARQADVPPSPPSPLSSAQKAGR